MHKTMSQKKLYELIETIVESALDKKLREILGDPDWGFTLKRKIRDRLLRQKKSVAAGERGKALEEVAEKLGLE